MSTSKADVEEGDILGDADVSNPMPDHLLMTELSDVPPAQLLDGGSEDMEMVGCYSDAEFHTERGGGGYSPPNMISLP